MKIFKYVQVRTCSRRALKRFQNALEKMAAPLRWRQVQWLWNVGKDSSKTRRELGQFSRIVSHLPTEVIETWRLRQIAFNDLDERKMGIGFLSFIAMADEASEANARRVLRHLHRQPGLADAGSAPQHH